MQKVNELFGKRVINQGSGDSVATVRDVVLSDDAQRIVALVAGNTNGRPDDDYVVRWDSVVSVGEYVIIDGSKPNTLAREDSEVVDLRKKAEQITDKPVISTSGEKLGHVTDMYYDESGVLVGYAVRQGAGGLFSPAHEPQLLAAQYIQAVGKDAVIATVNEFTPLQQGNSQPTLAQRAQRNDEITTPLGDPNRTISMPAQNGSLREEPHFRQGPSNPAAPIKRSIEDEPFTSFEDDVASDVPDTTQTRR